MSVILVALRRESRRVRPLRLTSAAHGRRALASRSLSPGSRLGCGSVVRCWSELKKEHSPTRNQLTGKSHEEKSKNSKPQNPHYRSTAQAVGGTAVRERGACISGRPETQLGASRFGFGKGSVPLRTRKSIGTWIESPFVVSLNSHLWKDPFPWRSSSSGRGISA